MNIKIISVLTTTAMFIAGCSGFPSPSPVVSREVNLPSSQTPTPIQPTVEPFPTRPIYTAGELVDYMAQTGDTIPALASHFNTTVEEIYKENPNIPSTATTMPPGMPMKIPIYHLPFWGSSYKIIPDSDYVLGPESVGFDTSIFLANTSSWLNRYSEYAFGSVKSSAEIIDLVSRRYSISPKVLLALMDYQSGALSSSKKPDFSDEIVIGNQVAGKSLFTQITWTANTLNNGYYGWRIGKLGSITLADGRLERFDPWLNSATVALHYYFNQIRKPLDYDRAISEDGYAKTYRELFGTLDFETAYHIGGDLTQPEFVLPFELNRTWAYTGGPHTGWGEGEPFSALDFAPPTVGGGCINSDEWVTAVAPGIVVRSEVGVVVLDLDKDGDERTGWDILFLHMATDGRAQVGEFIDRYQPLGHPSCEGGSSTGTHVHIARKYNGEWISAGGIIPFVLEGWEAVRGIEEYQGTLVRNSEIVTACVCSNRESMITAGR